MAESIVNFPERIYVGTKGLMAFNMEDPPLGFSTPFGKDAAFAKRKSTVDHWCGDGFEHVERLNVDGAAMTDQFGRIIRDRVQTGFQVPHDMLNEPLEGFQFDKSVSRWVTSNKWFRITDPRGFQLEISAANLSDILLNGAITKGTLVGKYVWGRQDSNIYLTRVDHPDYLAHLTPAFTRALLPGDVVMLGSKPQKYVYHGKVYVYEVDWDQNNREQKVGRYYDRYGAPSYSTITKRHKAPFQMFTLYPEPTQDYYKDTVVLTKKASKVTVVGEGQPIVIPADGTYRRNMGAGGTHMYIFGTKDAVAAFNMTAADVIGRLKAQYQNFSYTFTAHEHKDV